MSDHSGGVVYLMNQLSSWFNSSMVVGVRNNLLFKKEFCLA